MPRRQDPRSLESGLHSRGVGAEPVPKYEVQSGGCKRAPPSLRTTRPGAVGVFLTAYAVFRVASLAGPQPACSGPASEARSPPRNTGWAAFIWNPKNPEA
jgi:hypothetical protein